MIIFSNIVMAVTYRRGEYDCCIFVTFRVKVPEIAVATL